MESPQRIWLGPKWLSRNTSLTTPAPNNVEYVRADLISAEIEVSNLGYKDGLAIGDMTGYSRGYANGYEDASHANPMRGE